MSGTYRCHVWRNFAFDTHPISTPLRKARGEETDGRRSRKRYFDVQSPIQYTSQAVNHVSTIPLLSRSRTLGIVVREGLQNVAFMLAEWNGRVVLSACSVCVYLVSDINVRMENREPILLYNTEHPRMPHWPSLWISCCNLGILSSAQIPE